MIHPDTELQWISETKGFGLFARKRIPVGTITYIQDPLDLVISVFDPLLNDERYTDIIDKYSFFDSFGNAIISWDNAKYMNHCCFANTLTTGYGFEIAVRNIEAGEEITDDYGIFTVAHNLEMECSEGRGKCRRRLDIGDFDELCPMWDAEVKDALSHFRGVQQPLAKFMNSQIKQKLDTYLDFGVGYLSVALQKPDVNLVARELGGLFQFEKKIARAL
ncbi:MAG: SET domain-containing protein [Oligoflexales bacterium]|nr:SET domain-containing protein [Oligoflexales bacterium]